MEREKRLDLIKLLLKNNKISTVRELAEIMEEQYNLIFSMTTVAKDLQHLRVTKVPNGSAPSYYVLPEKMKQTAFVKLSRNIAMIVSTLLSLKTAIS